MRDRLLEIPSHGCALSMMVHQALRIHLPRSRRTRLQVLADSIGRAIFKNALTEAQQDKCIEAQYSTNGVLKTTRVTKS